MNVLGLCAGIGGLELGFKVAFPESRCVGFVERESYVQAVLVARMASKDMDSAPIWDDVRTFDGEAYRGKVDFMLAGIPCQPFSSAGKQKHTEDTRWIWPDVLRVLDETRCWGLFLENVPGLRKKGLPIILRDLAQRRWNTEWGHFTARSVGAPHIRSRLFILALAEGWPDRIDLLCSRLGHANGQGLEKREGIKPNPKKKFKAARGTSSSVANANGFGFGQGSFEEIRKEDWWNEFERSGSFLPGRSRELWARMPPSAQPAICGKHHGVPAELVFRSDRIKALGNAVIPLVAAYAVKTLLYRFRGE